MESCRHRRDAAIEFLRPWGEHVARSQASFDVSHRDLAIERTHRRGQSCRRIALGQHQGRPEVIQDVSEANQYISSCIIQALTGPHDVEIEIRSDIEKLQDRMEQLSVLSSDTDFCVESFRFPQGPYYRGHFYCIWPCPENHYNIDHPPLDLSH